MSRSIFIFLLALFAIVHFSVADANWRDDAAELKKIRHDNFELRAYPAPQANAFNFTFGDLQPNGESVFFLYQKNVLSFSISDGTKQDINDVVIDGKTPLIIRRHGIWLEVLTPSKRLCRVVTFAKLKGQFLVAKADGKPAIEKLDYQRLEPFAFGDDFMRTEEEAKQWGVWTPVSGDWKIYSVMERIHDNPAARIREGYEPVADRSPNPFCLSAQAPQGEAIIVTGYDFWCDYEASVSIKPFLSQFGLIFGYQDEKNFNRVEWNLPTLGESPAKLAVIRRENGKDTILQSIMVMGRSETWWKLAVRLYGDEFQVLLDDAVVTRSVNPSFIGGKIGLYAKGANETFFDDVEVKTITDARLGNSVSELLNKSVIAANPNAADDAKWSNGNDAVGIFSAPSSTAADNRSFTAIGCDDWPAQRVEISLLNSQAAGAQGLAVGNKQQYRAVWTAADGGQIQLRQTDGAAEKTIVSLPCPWDGKAPLRLAADTTYANAVTVWADGKLMIRHPIAAQELGGKIAILAESKDAKFADLVLFATLNRDWEQTVDIARFANDPFMQGWASSRYAWIKQGDKAEQSYPQTHVYTGDLYGAFTLDAPIQPGLNYHFGADDPKSADSYLLKTELDAASLKGTLTLSKGDKVLASKPFTSKAKTVIPGSQIIDEKIGEQPRTPDTDSYGKLSFQKDGHAFWASVDGVELFCVHDDKPLTGRAFAVDIPAMLDFIHLELKRESLKDYLFEKAETDWIQSGRWQVTNRFACDPRWSHMNGESKGTAALWSKFDLDGDYTIECFAGMRMRQGELLEGARISYPRVGDINVALDGDGHELFSGYNLIVSAWDARWSEKWTQFWRRDKVVTQSDAELIPRNRFRSPVTRAIAVDYDPGGRPVHGAWYALKIRKTGSNYDVWFDNTPVFSFNETSPLEAGRRIALWTQHNSIVLARVKVNYRHFSRRAPVADLQPEAAAQPDFRPLPPTVQEELPALKILSAAHFLTPFQFTSWNGDQSAEVADISAEGHSAWIFRNANSGGDFGAKIPLEHVDLMQVAKLEFDFQASQNAFVNLYFSIDEDPVSRYFITLSGPDYDGPNLYKISGIQKPKADEWTHVSIDLNRAIHAKYPWRKSWTLNSMMIGMLHEGYLNAGLNGNQRGATYMIRDMKLATVHPADITAKWLLEPEKQPPEYRAWFAAANDDGQAAPASVAVLKDTTHVFTPQTATDKYLIFETKQPDGTWKRLTAYECPQPVAAPLTAVLLEPAPGQPWGGNPIAIQFQGPENVVPVLEDTELVIDKQTLRLNALNTTYDSARRILSIQPLFSAFKADQQELAGSFSFHDCTARTMRKSQWTFAFDRSLDKTPPSLPNIKDAKTALAGLAYPNLEISPNNLGSRIKLDFTMRDDVQLPAAHATNTICGTDAAVNFKFPPFSANQYPFISFDYNIPDPQTYIDLLLIGAVRSAFGMTDREAREDQYLQDIPDIQADGKWHRAIIDLRPYFDSRSTTFPQQSWNVNQVSVGNFYYSGTEPGSTYAVSNMRLAQIATTINGPFAINWSSNDPSGVAGYSYVWDEKDGTMPDTTPETALSSASFEKLEPGLKYFHIRAVDKNGNWGPAAHYLYFVDNSTPKAIATTPLMTSKCAADAITVTFNPDGGSMNFSGASLEVNGTQRTLNRANTTFDPKTRTLTWNMLSDNNLMGGTMKNGDVFIAKLNGVRNIAGVEAPPVEWSWNADFSQDRKPPLPPTVSTMGNNAFRHVIHYSSRAPLWNNYRHADIEYVNDEITHSQCLQMSLPADITNRRFLYYMQRSITTAEFPFLRFRYRIMPGTKVNLNFNFDHKYYTVKMTGSEENVESVIGTIPEAKDDGQWRWALLNLRELFAKAFPDKKNFSFNIMVFGDYGKPTAKSCMRIDDVAFVPELSPFQLYYFSSSDATGIAAFNADLTQDMEKAELKQMNPKLLRSRIPVEIPDAKGLWFLAAQSQDGAGNLSEVVNYPFFCSQPAIADSKTEGLEATTDGTPWRVRAFSATDKRTYCYSRLARTGQDNLLIASQFFGYPHPDVLFYRRLGKTLQQTPPRRIRADLFTDVGDSYKVSVVLLDANLVPLAESDVKTMKADGEWHRRVIFNLPEINGTPIFIAFHLQMADKSRALLSFDNVRNVKITPTAAKPAVQPKPAEAVKPQPND